jgi:hypothetical protein
VLTRALNLDGFFDNTDMRFGTWNIQSLYRAGSLITVLRELSRYITFSGSAGGLKDGQGH